MSPEQAHIGLSEATLDENLKILKYDSTSKMPGTLNATWINSHVFTPGSVTVCRSAPPLQYTPT